MQLPLTTDEIHPPNPPAHPGSPYDSNGNCIHHPSVKLARLANPNDPDDTYIIERKHCPKCCLNSIIRDTARKTNIIGQHHSIDVSTRSLGWINGSVTSPNSRGAVNSFRSYRGTPTTSSHDASASLSLPYSFEEGHGVRLDRKEITNERIIDDDGGNGSYYSRQQRGPRRDARSLDGSSYTYSYRDPRDIPFRTQKDPSVVSSSSISSRMQSSRTLESPSLKSATRSKKGGQQQQGSVRSHSPESKGSTIGMSTIPSTAGDSSLASTCSTITMDTSFRKNRRRKNNNNNNNKKHRQFSSGLDPVREGDSRGRDPEESGSSRGGSSGGGGNGNGKPHIPTQ
eukprot:scaffold91673_cov22-Cyclotella_meneghiniana.AAC.1